MTPNDLNRRVVAEHRRRAEIIRLRLRMACIARDLWWERGMYRSLRDGSPTPDFESYHDNRLILMLAKANRKAAAWIRRKGWEVTSG